MRTLAAPSEGDATCTRSPLVSLRSIATSPGVMSSFSSISSRSRTSTRTRSSRGPRAPAVGAADTARRLEQLLLALLAVEPLPPHRLVLEPAAAAGGGDDHLLGQLEMRPQLH